MSGEGEVVCVTGASGSIGSWVVSLLLARGYTVHGTVRNLKDGKETKHLESFEGAASHLRLFQIDLLDYDSLAAAINGCVGVFHLASPCSVDQVQDPQKELLDPAIKGTLNVLTAAKELGVKRVLWYPISKTLAEKAAWEFSKEKGLDVVVVNPGTVMGPNIPPIPWFKDSFGCTETYQDFFIGSVHFKDVALAHILVYENKSATRRDMCVESISHYGDFVAKVAELYPEYNIPSLPRDTQPGLLRAKDGGKKLMDLGLEFIPMEQIIKDAVESLKTFPPNSLPCSSLFFIVKNTQPPGFMETQTLAAVDRRRKCCGDDRVVAGVREPAEDLTMGDAAPLGTLRFWDP
ncbi:Ferritin 4 [Hibiscus syriacus]|uniref:Ferritin 4 n=1 Tax=Hibiscus syriacus TaxID=106335 RepID=A0A6A2Z5P7_HIBSY|nr:Ferritin 4 [Hibiscus syriacus]